MEITEPSEITVGTRVFCPYPKSLRALDPRLDVGKVVGLDAEFAWVEKAMGDGTGTLVTSYPLRRLEAIG